MVLHFHTREEVQGSITAGRWTIAWGSLVTEANLVKSITPVHSSNALAWISQHLNPQLEKYEQTLETVSGNVIDEAAQFLCGLQDHKYIGEAEIAGLQVKAGIAEYFSSRRMLGSGELPQKIWQPYFGLRVTKPLPPKEPEQASTPIALDSNTWYKFVNNERPTLALDVVNDGNQLRDGRLKVAARGNYSGQYWQLRPTDLTLDTYTLCTMWLGSGMCLETSSNEVTRPRLAAAQPCTIPLERQWYIDFEADGTCRLRNAKSMELLAVDASGKYLTMTDNQDLPLCKWALQRAGPIREGGFEI